MKTTARILKVAAISICVLFAVTSIPWLQIQLNEMPDSPELNNAILMVLVPCFLALLYVIPYEFVLKHNAIAVSYLVLVFLPLIFVFLSTGEPFKWIIGFLMLAIVPVGLILFYNSQKQSGDENK